MPEQEPPYEVGYAKPPKNGQFTKGQSGNPKGRPKGAKSMASIVLRESRQLLRVNGPHGSRQATKLEAAVMQLGNKAAQGDLRAQREFYSLIQWSEESANADVTPQAPHEKDRKVMETLRQRLQAFQSNNQQSTTENPE
jgi:hypothetical protein